MASPTTTSGGVGGGRKATALVALHYAAPIATAVYFLAAKTAAACILQRAATRTGSKWRRYAAIALQLLVVATVLAEGMLSLTSAIQEPDWTATQDDVVYVIILAMVHASLALGLLENGGGGSTKKKKKKPKKEKKPLWHPYLGAWLVALACEISIFALHGWSKVPANGFAKGRMICAVVRALGLLALALSTVGFVISDRRRVIRLDAESESQLASAAAAANRTLNPNSAGNLPKPTPSPADSLFPSEDSGANTVVADNDSDDDSDDDDAGFDSDTEDPEGDKAMRAAQKQRLAASGSWLNYLREFKIFVPMLIPSDDRFVQFCFGVVGAAMLAERALNILVPRQLGIITTDLASTAAVPWRALGLWMLYAALNSGAGIPLVRKVFELPIDQYGYKAIATTAFAHIMGLSMDFHSGKNSGELIRAIEQGTNLQDLVNFVFFDIAPIFFDLMLAVVYVATLFDVYMSLILFVVGVAYVWIGVKVTAWSIQQRRDYNTAFRLESKVQNEAINNWQTVSHFNRGRYEAGRYGDTVDGLNRAGWWYWLTYDLGGGLQSFVMTGGKLAAVLLAVYRVAQGRAPIGNLISLLTYWTSIQMPLATVSYSVRRVSQMLTDSERLLQLLTTQPSVADAPRAPPLVAPHGAVVFEHVDFAYDPRKPTLSDVSFAVQPGQTVALVGETGGGKSTILKLLYRYYDVSGGSITIDGQDIRAVTLDSLRDTFGMVPQDPALFNVSILENIKYARLDATDEEVQAACRAAAIHDKIASFPDGYASLVGERGVKLSGGELQRVAIARAILRRPTIVLLDEATSMIDAETEATIQHAFRSLSAHRTTFIVAHRLATIQHADLILVISDGRIVERGSHDELFRQNGKYVALWSKQLSKTVAAAPEPLVNLDDEDEEDDNNNNAKASAVDEDEA